jgi:hypothetical protein
MKNTKTENLRLDMRFFLMFSHENCKMDITIPSAQPISGNKQLIFFESRNHNFSLYQ